MGSFEDNIDDDAAKREELGWRVTVRTNGKVLFEDMVVGSFDFVQNDVIGPDAATATPRLTLNLGWLKAAGLGIRIQGDPDVDRSRSGIVLER